MSSLGNLTVSVSSNTAEFERGMSKVDRLSKQVFNDMTTYADTAKKAVAAVGIGISLAKVTSEFTNLSQAIDNTYKTAQKLGIATQDLSELRYAAKMSAISVSTLDSGIGRLTKTLYDASQGNKEAYESLASLGVAATNSSGQLRDTKDVLEEIAERIALAEDGATKTALAMKIFGRSAGPDLIPLLNTGRDGIAAMAEEAQSLGHSINDELGKAAEDFNDNMSRLKDLAALPFRTLAKEAIPVLADTTDRLIQMRSTIEMVAISAASAAGVMAGMFALSKIKDATVSMVTYGRRIEEATQKNLLMAQSEQVSALASVASAQKKVEKAAKLAGAIRLENGEVDKLSVAYSKLAVQEAKLAAAQTRAQIATDNLSVALKRQEIASTSLGKAKLALGNIITGLGGPYGLLSIALSVGVGWLVSWKLRANEAENAASTLSDRISQLATNFEHLSQAQIHLRFHEASQLKTELETDIRRQTNELQKIENRSKELETSIKKHKDTLNRQDKKDEWMNFGNGNNYGYLQSLNQLKEYQKEIEDRQIRLNAAKDSLKGVNQQVDNLGKFVDDYEGSVAAYKKKQQEESEQRLKEAMEEAKRLQEEWEKKFGKGGGGKSSKSKATDDLKNDLDRLNAMFLEAEGINKTYYDTLASIEKLFNANRISATTYAQAIEIVYTQETALNEAIRAVNDSLTQYGVTDQKYLNDLQNEAKLIGKTESQRRLLTAQIQLEAQAAERLANAKTDIETAYEKEVKHIKDVEAAQIKLASSENEVANIRAKAALAIADVQAKAQFAIEGQTKAIEEQAAALMDNTAYEIRRIQTLNSIEELKAANAQYALNYIFDEDKKNRAILQAEHETWQARIELAEKGTEERKRLEEEYALYIQNRSIAPIVEKWERNMEDINRSLTDALMRGFEDGESFAENFIDTLKNAFQTLILRPTIEAILKPVQTSVLEDVTKWAGADKKFSFSNIGSDFASLGNSISNLASGIGSIGAIASSVGAVMPYIGVAAAGLSLASSLFGSKGGAKVGATYTGEYDSQGRLIDEYRRHPSGGGDITIVKSVVDAMNQSYQEVARSIGATVLDSVKFGAYYDTDPKGTADSYAKLWYSLNGTDIGIDKKLAFDENAIAEYSKNVVLTALKASNLPEEIRAILDRVDETTASGDAIDAVVKIAQTAQTITQEAQKLGLVFHEAISIEAVERLQTWGEEVDETLVRLINEFEATNYAARILGQSMSNAFGEVGLASEDARKQLIDFSGGLDAFASKVSFFDQNFYSEQERTAREALYAYDQLEATFNSINITIPQTRQEFRSLTESLDLSTESGRKMYSTMLNMAEAFDLVASEFERMVEEAEAALLAAKEAFLSLYDAELAAAESRVAELLSILTDRYNDMLSVSASAVEQAKSKVVQSIVDMFQAIYDESVAAKQALQQLYLNALTEAESTLSAAESAVESILKSIVDTYLNRVSTAETALRSAYSLQAQVIQSTIDRLTKLSGTLRDYQDSLLLSDKTVLNPQEQYDEAARQFWEGVAKAQGGDVDALESLQGLSNNFLDASREYYASTEKYAQDFNSVLGVLADAGISIEELIAAQEQDKITLDALVGQFIYLQETITQTVDGAVEELIASREALSDIQQNGFESVLNDSTKAIIDQFGLWDSPIFNMEKYLESVAANDIDASLENYGKAAAEVSALQTEGVVRILTESQKAQLEAIGALNDPIFAVAGATAITIPDAVANVTKTHLEVTKWLEQGIRAGFDQSTIDMLAKLGILEEVEEAVLAATKNAIIEMDGTRTATEAVFDSLGELKALTAYHEDLQTRGLLAALDDQTAQELLSMGELAESLLGIKDASQKTLPELILDLKKEQERLTDLQVNGVAAILDEKQKKEAEALGLLKDPLLGIRDATTLTIPLAFENLKKAQEELNKLQEKGISGILEELQKQTNQLNKDQTINIVLPSEDKNNSSNSSNNNSSSSSPTYEYYIRGGVTNYDDGVPVYNDYWISQSQLDNLIGQGRQVTILNKKIKSYAKGGQAEEGLAIVGEEGPELVQLNLPSRITPANDTKYMMDNREVVKELQAIRADMRVQTKQNGAAYMAMIKRLEAVEDIMDSIDSTTRLQAVS